MKAGIVCVGSELLTGSVADTNGSHIARRLMKAGIDPAFQVTVGDDLDCIATAVDEACRRADVVIVSGGLGPTHDDLTRRALAKAAGRELQFSAELEAGIRRFFESKGKQMSPLNRVQAFLPLGSRAIANPLGTAPGIEMEHEGARVYALPGVPGEMEVMLSESVLPLIAQAPAGGAATVATLWVAGVGEADLAQRIGDVVEACRASGGPEVSILASGGRVAVGLRASASGQDAADRIGPVESKIRRLLGDDVFGAGDQTLEAVVIEMAAARGLTLSVAESFTGGSLASLLVSVPGSSAVFHTGFVTYAPEAKIKQLGVPADLLERHGAVSKETASAMALGARTASGASIGLSTTGEAGPDPQEKPVGTVFIGVSWDGGSQVRRLTVSGSRGEIRSAGATAALDTLRRWMQDRDRA
ncbi:MAG: competence/damage-inducible protein A [Actinomycetota bacterium]